MASFLSPVVDDDVKISMTSELFIGCWDILRESCSMVFFLLSLGHEFYSRNFINFKLCVTSGHEVFWQVCRQSSWSHPKGSISSLWDWRSLQEMSTKISPFLRWRREDDVVGEESGQVPVPQVLREVRQHSETILNIAAKVELETSPAKSGNIWPTSTRGGWVPNGSGKPTSMGCL